MSKITKVSKFIKALLIFLTLLQGSVYVVLFLFATTRGESSEIWFHYLGLSSGVSMNFTGSWSDLAQALVKENFNPSLILGIPDGIPYFLIYYFLYKLFSLYQQGIIFTLNNSQYIKNIAVVLIAWVALKLVYPIVVTLVLRFSGLSDSLPLFLNFGSEELAYLLTGLVIYVIAWVMNEATALQQEQELII
jgi:hypothetical protein